MSFFEGGGELGCHPLVKHTDGLVRISLRTSFLRSGELVVLRRVPCVMSGFVHGFLSLHRMLWQGGGSQGWEVDVRPCPRPGRLGGPQ
jgi:hypothetical protein